MPYHQLKLIKKSVGSRKKNWLRDKNTHSKILIRGRINERNSNKINYSCFEGERLLILCANSMEAKIKRSDIL